MGRPRDQSDVTRLQTIGDKERRREAAGPRFSRISFRSSTGYAAITASIGTLNSTGQRCAYRAPANKYDGHLAIIRYLPFFSARRITDRSNVNGAQTRSHRVATNESPGLDRDAGRRRPTFRVQNPRVVTRSSRASRHSRPNLKTSPASRTLGF